MGRRTKKSKRRTQRERQEELLAAWPHTPESGQKAFFIVLWIIGATCVWFLGALVYALMPLYL